MNCPLCNDEACMNVPGRDSRPFFRCGGCGLVFVPASDHVSIAEEKQRYDLHRNDSASMEYVSYLQELVRFISDRYPRPARLLDYGCGKNSVLTGLLQHEGYDCTAYDPLYHIGDDAPEKTYAVVIMCEVVEHLRDLQKEMRLVKAVLGKNGEVVVRTRIAPPPDQFAVWWYANDPTHINFFSKRALEKMAALMGLSSVTAVKNDLFILQ